MPSNHFILCCSFLLPPLISASIWVFPNESALYIRWLKYRSFSFSISPSNEESGLISFRVGCFHEDISEQILKRELDQGWCPCQICFSPQGRVSQRTGPSQLFPPPIFYLNREPLKRFALWKGTCLCDAHKWPLRLLTSQNASVQRRSWKEPAPCQPNSHRYCLKAEDKWHTVTQNLDLLSSPHEVTGELKGII